MLRSRLLVGRKTLLKRYMLDAPGHLFLGSDVATAQAQGPRAFRTAAKAIRFAMEHAAPVSLRGAMLVVGAHRYGPTQIRSLHSSLCGSA